MKVCHYGQLQKFCSDCNSFLKTHLCGLITCNLKLIVFRNEGGKYGLEAAVRYKEYALPTWKVEMPSRKEKHQQPHDITVRKKGYPQCCFWRKMLEINTKERFLTGQILLMMAHFFPESTELRQNGRWRQSEDVQAYSCYSGHGKSQSPGLLQKTNVPRLMEEQGQF